MCVFVNVCLCIGVHETLRVATYIYRCVRRLLLGLTLLFPFFFPDFFRFVFPDNYVRCVLDCWG